MLPLNHFLRSRGQNPKCCPINYYKIDAEITPTPDISKFNCYHVLKLPPGLLASFSPCDEDNKKTIKEMIGSGKGLINWYNEEEHFALDKLRDFLFAQYPDYRPFIEYQRVTTETYLRDGNSAEIQGAPVNGVHGIPGFARLPYFDFAKHINWDPFHVLQNIAKNFIFNLKGKQ
jgi:hypothetical protein